VKTHTRLFQLFLLLLPSQLALHFWPQFAFVNGLKIDYLSPTLYLTDLIFIAMIFSWIFSLSTSIKKIINTRYSFLVTGFIILNLLFSVSPASSLLLWVRIVEIIILYFYIINNKFKINFVLKPLAIGVIATCLLAAAQLLTTRNVGGVFYWLGERPLGIYQPGVALVDIFGVPFLRPYATFPHPNALAGYAGLLFLFSLSIKENVNRFAKSLFRICCLFIVLAAYSQAVWIGLAASFFIFKIKFSIRAAMLGALALSLLSPLFFQHLDYGLPIYISQRVDLSITAGHAFANYPIFGVGLGQFIRVIPQYFSSPIWWLQPVHNIFLLVATETGVVGLAVFILFLLKSHAIRKYAFIFVFVLVTSLVDHYWLTSHQNLMLLAVVFATIKNNDFTH